MFYNFAAPRSIAKYRRVSRACNFCRAHRIRCDAKTPCAQCVKAGGDCRRLHLQEEAYNDGGVLSSQPVPRKKIRTDKEPNALIQPTSPDSTRTLTPQHQSTESESVTAQLDSTVEFITRINTFCSGISRLSSQTVPHKDDPGPYRSPFCPGNVDVISSNQCHISSVQLNSLMWVFWTRLRISPDSYNLPRRPSAFELSLCNRGPNS